MTSEIPPSADRNGLDDVAKIDPRERDINLSLHSPDWGKRLESPWTLAPGEDRYFFRDIRVRGCASNRSDLRDYVVRFPSAPIYGINRTQDYEVKFTDERPNLHTLRLLTRPPREEEGEEEQPIERLFILHNGLNESTNLRFFYQLADWLLAEDRSEFGPARSACLLVPFPGHLMHFPYAGPFAQSPLSRYLNDAGDLFRHFLRYMIEMQWLLSVMNNCPIEEWPVGSAPIGPAARESELLRSWIELRDASLLALTPDSGEDEDGSGKEAEMPSKEKVVGPGLDQPDINSISDVLRGLLGRDLDSAPARLPVHVVGYSLGGFLAQSTFFAWPNMVDSCSTICSGGALRTLSPTAFAHSEEWQAVLHSLRPEIEGSMLSGQISRDSDNRVAGMEGALFGYFHRIFNQVFLQEDAKSYKQRLSEYGSRMLFISGGEDPIVTTKDVLDASPDEGITMLSVARLTHFLGQEAQTIGEEKQRKFWLPEAGGMIARAASWAEELKQEEVEQAVALRESARKATVPPPKIKRPTDRDLASPQFESALDWVVDGVAPDEGWLFVCRNAIPAAFLPIDQHELQGAALHHHDVPVQTYASGLARRSRKLEDLRSRITLCVSENLGDTYIGRADLFDPHSDAVGSESTKERRVEVWNQFEDAWADRMWRFHAGLLNLPRTQMPAAGILGRAAARWQGVPLADFKVSRLPDVWISIGEIKGLALLPDNPELTANSFVDWVGKIIKEQQSKTAQANSGEERSNKLRSYIKNGRVRVVQVSGTELNPRYRGRYEESFGQVLLLLAHCAGALIRSKPVAVTESRR